ncbi:MAG: TetR/AcrR family transcriptional regulator [Emcibacteraceae bacterium]|nr:TetR/AcrR family transcriptional regulator [Emcibacteraceae bacterium]
MVRGRPRKIEPDAALKSAMIVFWQKGFDGTSMADLVKATGMAKPGLYATFGDKQEIYSKALEQYVKDRGFPIARKLMASEKSTRDAVRDFLQDIAINMFDQSTPNGCFLVNTIVESEAGYFHLEVLGRKYNDKRREILSHFFQNAKTAGKISATSDPEALAEFYMAQALTIPVLDKAGISQKSMDRFIETALMVLRDE